MEISVWRPRKGGAEMKVYRIGKSIILPHVRFVILDSHNDSLMFHSKLVRNKGKYKTLGCDKMDSSGFCLGHEMSMEEFYEKYCHGTETEEAIK
jgi:hypothetical protein